MKREYHRWYSSRLGIELGVVVYGHWGQPLLGFPTSVGDTSLYVLVSEIGWGKCLRVGPHV
jgi:esterase/lipase superfamily enzyme